jgi:PAS domain S-box-containing protein
MTIRKKKPEENEPETRAAASSLREHAEEQLKHSAKDSSSPAGQTQEGLIHELQVHQIELETQAEELRRVYLELEESRDKYLDLYEFAPAGYLTLTDKGLISEANLTSATLLGIDRGSLIGARFSRFVAERVRDAWHRYFISVVGQSEKKICNLPLIRADGSEVPARLESIRISRTGNEALTVRVAISDISDLRRLQDALRISNKKLSLLSGITRHDINNQLLSLNGYLGLLHHKVTDPALEEDFTLISEISDRITRIIQFTKVYDQIGVKNPTWQDCRMLVETAAQQVRLGNITVENNLPVGGEMFADPLIAQVFYNLVENAVRHGGKITTIRFSLQGSEKKPVIICEDDGDGVAADEKEMIFKSGFGNHTGMGLTLSREILDITGITIRETGEPEHGARFETAVPEGGWRIMRAERRHDA